MVKLNKIQAAMVLLGSRGQDIMVQFKPRHSEQIRIMHCKAHPDMLENEASLRAGLILVTLTEKDEKHDGDRNEVSVRSIPAEGIVYFELGDIQFEVTDE